MNKKEKSYILGSNDNVGTLFCGKLKGVKVNVIFRRKKEILNSFKFRKMKTQISMLNNLRVTSIFLQKRGKKGSIQTFIFFMTFFF